MKKVWEESFKIASYHLDFQQELKPSVLQQYFQEAAGNHAESLGAGYDTLMARELFWALSRIRVEIERMPKWGETIRIETWPVGLERLFFRRDFLMYDEQDNVIVRGASGWLLVNAKSMRPQRLSALGVELPDNGGRTALDAPLPDRISLETPEPAFRKVIRYDEIDMNMHVNNTRYLDWVTDCFDREHYEQNAVSAFTLEFLSEVHWGDEMEMQIEHNGTQAKVQAVETASAKALFKADVEWRKRD